MKKHVTDMTVTEKQERISYLTLTVHDINAIPSVLLQNELRDTVFHFEQTAHTLNAIYELERLESQYRVLEDKYSSEIAVQLRPLKRIFDYEYTKLINQQKAELQKHTVNPLIVPSHILQKHRHEQNMLKQQQIARRTQIEQNAQKPLILCRDKLFNTFTNAVKYLYR